MILADILRIPDWTSDALCTQLDADDLWFPTSGNASPAARRICAQCPTRAACLQYALDAPFAVFGIWAGTNERQRRPMRKAAA